MTTSTHEELTQRAQEILAEVPLRAELEEIVDRIERMQRAYEIARAEKERSKQ
jgi:hypothetical protein